MTDANGEFELCVKEGAAVTGCCSEVCVFFNQGLIGGIPVDIFKVENMTALCAPYFWRWVLF